MKKLSFLIIVAILLAACQVTQPQPKPIVSYNKFDNHTTIASPPDCYYSDDLSQLCMTIAINITGNYSYEDWLVMNEFTRNSLIKSKAVIWLYKAKSWLFVEDIVIKVDNKKYRTPFILGNREIGDYGRITEAGLQMLVEGTEIYEFFQKLYNGEFEEKEIQIRVYGESSHVDFHGKI